MNFKKGLSAIALLLALTTVGCNKKGADASASTNSKAPVASTSSKATSKSATSVAPSSSAVEEDPLLTPLVRTYTEGDAAKNSDEKDYIPLTDATANKVGVKIAITNYTVGSDANAETKLTSDGKIDPVNQNDAILTYRIKAPKAGNYQMVMTGKSKADALERTLEGRAFTVKLNGETVDIKGDRAPLQDTDTVFVAAPTVALTGNEDKIEVSCCNYRIQFSVTSFILFNEI